MRTAIRRLVKPSSLARGSIILGALMAVLVAAFASAPGYAHAQSGGIRVTIFRPGEGEAIYSSASPPYAAIPITGLVTAGDISRDQLQVRLDVLRGGQIVGGVGITPNSDGTFQVDVGINQHPVTDLAEAEQGCDGRCHQYQTLTLPTGQLTLRVTASDPLGRKAVAQRSIVVDATGHVNVPVQVVVDGEPGLALRGVKINAATRLYEWRTRTFSAETDATGVATFHLERLSEAATHYIIQIEPGIADGIFVTHRMPVSVTLPAGTASVAPVTLVARTQRGQISGNVESQGLGVDGLAVRLVDLASGAARTAPVAQGKFSLNDIPLAKYLLSLDETQAATHDVYARPQAIDLTSAPVAPATLKVTASARTVRGVVRDSDGNPIPFAWVAADGEDKTARVGLFSGQFVLGDLAPVDHVLWVTAPGYFSRPLAVAHRMDIKLYIRPDTRRVPWGSGFIMLPSQTLADPSGNQISLRRGWVWGKGTGSFSIRTPELDILLSAGAFALEYLPGETNWLYLPEGQAQLATRDGNIDLSAGQMIAFGRGITRLKPVLFDDATAQAIHSEEKSQVAIETDSEISSRLVNEIERLGLPVSQAVGLGATVIGVCVIGALTFIRRRRSIHPNE